MKKIMIVALALGLAMGVSAQRFGHGGYGGGRHVYIAPPRVSVGVGFGYSPFYSPYYSPFGYAPYGYNNVYSHRPTKLDLQVEDIKNDYEDKIWSAKHDDNLSRKQKRQTVHQLRSERDQAITDAKRNYYKY